MYSSLVASTRQRLRESQQWYYLDDLVRLTQSSPSFHYPNLLLMGQAPPPSPAPEPTPPPSAEDIWEAIARGEAPHELSAEVEEDECPGCGVILALQTDMDLGSMVCRNCGLVVQTQESDLAECGGYSGDGPDGISRYGCTTDFFSPKASEGTIMVGLNNPRLDQKQKWSCTSYRDKSLEEVRDKIRKICADNHIPGHISNKAQDLYKIVSDCVHQEGPNRGNYIIIRGKNREKIIAACVYNACRLNKWPHNVIEIGRYFGLENSDVSTGVRKFDKLISRHGCRLQMFEEYQETDSVEDFIRRHAAGLGFDQEIEDTAVQIAHNAARLRIGTDHNPQSMAAGVLMVVIWYYDLDIHKSEVSRLLVTSEVTINKIVQKIRPFLETEDALLDEEIMEHIMATFSFGPQDLDDL